MSDGFNTDVVIVGAGPVGLTLAIELGQRGVSCCLIEQNAKHLFLPKMELCNPRTMEIFRRIGVADQVRAAGYDPDLPMDVVITRGVSDRPILRLRYPSINIARTANESRNDGASPREVYQRISQYTLEPLLKHVAEALPSVTVRFATAFVGLQQDDQGVTATVRAEAGEERLRSRYLVGCDGASSAVRQSLGIRLTGHSQGPELCHVFFRSEDLMSVASVEPARHFYIVGKLYATLITQDTPDYFGVHAQVQPGADIEALIDEVVGRPVHKEILHVGAWQPRLLIADEFRGGRVMLAGDSAHQVIPFGGYGMNTGVGDVHDLAWKLDAVLKGWGGEALINSYEAERKPVGARNLAASGENTLGMMKWRAAHDAAVSSGQAVEAVDEATAKVANVEQRQSHERSAIELGYSYSGSSILAPEPDDEAPDPGTGRYRASAAPGNRLPHMWLANGVSTHDVLGRDFTLMVLDGSEAGAPLARALSDANIPCKTVVLDDPAVRALMGRRMLLIRPDEHVAWRGDNLPSDCNALIARISGRNQVRDVMPA